jgi:hypothetical protein
MPIPWERTWSAPFFWFNSDFRELALPALNSFTAEDAEDYAEAAE